MTSACYKRFVRPVKKREQLVTEFIAEFEKEYKKAKDTGCVFSDVVLDFCLLEACKLSEVRFRKYEGNFLKRGNLGHKTFRSLLFFFSFINKPPDQNNIVFFGERI